MAETDRHDKTEEPTAKRLEDARKEGRIPRSRELTAAAVMLTAGIVLTAYGPSMGAQLGELMRGGLSVSRAEAFDPSAMTRVFGRLSLAGLQAIVPVLLVTLIAALAAPMAIGGWSMSGKPLAPDFKRLSPMQGVQRMFGVRSWMELGKALAKFAVVAAVGIVFLYANTGRVMSLGAVPIHAAIGDAVQISGQALIALTSALVLIAAVDVPFQLWQYRQDMRMTKEEVKKEYKEAEGSPEVKGRIRALQREMSERRMMEEVPKADVIIVNPTHYAVALRYDDKTMRAPRVVAKGVDLIALRIRELANEHKVPIFEAPPLARALHRTVEIGDEIPSGLYVAVAQVLTYIFQLRAAKAGRGEKPPLPQIQMPPV